MVREIFAIKNDKPSSLPVFIVYLVPKDTMIATPVRVVHRNSKSVINISNGAIYTLGTQAFFDPIDAIELMVYDRKEQIRRINESLAEIEEFRQRVVKSKEGNKNAK